MIQSRLAASSATMTGFSIGNRTTAGPKVMSSPSAARRASNGTVCTICRGAVEEMLPRPDGMEAVVPAGPYLRQQVTDGGVETCSFRVLSGEENPDLHSTFVPTSRHWPSDTEPAP